MRAGLGRWALFLALAASDLHAQSVMQLEPSRDNTLYETPIDTAETQNERSNGAGNFLFFGRTGLDAGFRLRRAVLKFDLDTLPPGARILSATLRVYQSNAAPGSPPAEPGLHRLLQDWGEGDSKGIAAEGQGDFPADNDTTWHHRFYPDTSWDSAGGSYVDTPSAVMTIGQNLQHYTWGCAPALLADLRYWQENPEQNFGWIIVGGEIAGYSAHRINSRENANVEQRPLLTLVYLTADEVFIDGFEVGAGCG